MPFSPLLSHFTIKKKFIETTIKSILSQSFTDFELLLIDDASTDSSLEIASVFASNQVKS
jgi:glycosyltransferase involved in cell wall biosynthesis